MEIPDFLFSYGKLRRVIVFPRPSPGAADVPFSEEPEGSPAGLPERLRANSRVMKEQKLKSSAVIIVLSETTTAGVYGQ